MFRIVACCVTLLSMAAGPGPLVGQVCEGMPGPLGALTFAAGHNALNGHSGPDVSGRVHTTFGSVTASWTSSGIFPETSSTDEDLLVEQPLVRFSRPSSGEVGLHLALHHPSTPWICLRTGAQLVGWEQEFRSTEPVTPIPGSNLEVRPGSAFIFGRIVTLPVGVSLGESLPVTQTISLVPSARVSYVSFREDYDFMSSTWHDWHGRLGLSAKLSHLIVSGSVSHYFRDPEALSHLRVGVAYPFGGER